MDFQKQRTSRTPLDLICGCDESIGSPRTVASRKRVRTSVIIAVFATKFKSSLSLCMQGKTFERFGVPQNYIISFNLFAGQVNLGLVREYVEICDFLRLACKPRKEGG